MPNSQRLFQKIVHDTLDCITAYEECTQIIQSIKSDIHSDTFNTLSMWNNVVKNWRLEILSLTKHVERYSETSTGWIKLVDKIGLIIGNSSNFKTAMQSLILPNDKKVQQLIEAAIQQSRKLELINQALKEHEYQKLRTTEHW